MLKSVIVNKNELRVIFCQMVNKERKIKNSSSVFIKGAQLQFDTTGGVKTPTLPHINRAHV